MKRIISILLALSLALAMAPAALAATPQSCGDHATWTLEDGVLTISGTGAVKRFPWGNDPWLHNPDITELVIEEGITTLEDMCLSYIPNLQKITFPDSLLQIGSQVFQGCDKLEQITLPKNLRTMKEAASAFSGDSLKAIYVDPENPYFYSDDGVLIDRTKQAVICYPMGKADVSYQIPDGIRHIEYGAFWHCQAQQILLPQGLQTIGECAFFAAKFTDITLPNTLYSISSRAFANCDQLTTITVPASVTQIFHEVFASCEALKSITILNPQCQIASRNNALESTALLCGYSNSTLHSYAQRFGRCFQDVETGTVYNYDQGNLAYLDLLPQDTNSTSPCFTNILLYSETTGDIVGYQPHIMAEKDPDNATYQEMLAFVNTLTAHCPDDYAKAKVISQWVHENMTYVFGMMGGDNAEDVYRIWRNRCGNCECYTQLANFMLYLAGIPNATITSYAHTWSAAWLEGRWVMIDSTNNIFDSAPDEYDAIERICFVVDDNLVCMIDDLSGVKLASYGYHVGERAGITEITIPAYVTHIYYPALQLYTSALDLHNLTIRGTAGSYAEDYIRQTFPGHTFTYQDGMFSAKGHIYTNGLDGTCNICNVHRETVEEREVVHMFRMYNPNTGEHFYTGSEVERDNLIAVGWQYEGIGFTFPANTGDPVHRLFQPSTGEHLYTMDEAEKNKLIAEGWNYEGIAFNSAYNTEAVQHRLHNPNAQVGAYHFTFSEEEKQNLIAAGWEYQGIGWYSCWK